MRKVIDGEKLGEATLNITASPAELVGSGWTDMDALYLLHQEARQGADRPRGPEDPHDWKEPIGPWRQVTNAMAAMASQWDTGKPRTALQTGVIYGRGK